MEPRDPEQLSQAEQEERTGQLADQLSEQYRGAMEGTWPEHGDTTSLEDLLGNQFSIRDTRREDDTWTVMVLDGGPDEDMTDDDVINGTGPTIVDAVRDAIANRTA